mmetsp:Transcript_3462/g.5859  ORF Transcript_3462/g.5859 Transcript_3462/m.5859 type:complete len:132 (-) Transcript_3462:97-492(-)
MANTGSLPRVQPQQMIQSQPIEIPFRQRVDPEKPPSMIQRPPSQPTVSMQPAASSQQHATAEAGTIGLAAWNQLRQQWTAHPVGQPTSEPRRYTGLCTIEMLMNMDAPLPEALPLPVVVDALVEHWEDEDL